MAGLRPRPLTYVKRGRSSIKNDHVRPVLDPSELIVFDVVIACPKLDGVQASVDKLAEILTLEDIMVVRMEVPWCSGLNMIVKKALERSKKQVPVSTVIIGIDGSILKGN